MTKHHFSIILLFIGNIIYANKLPIEQSKSAFEINKGQFHPAIIARTDVENGYLFLTKNGFDILQKDNLKILEISHGHEKDSSIRNHHVKVKFLQSNQNSTIHVGEYLNRTSNYIKGNPEEWITEVNHTNTLLINDLYPNIDIKYFRNDEKLKYEYLIKANANYKQINLKYDGVDEIKIENGKLKYKTIFSDIYELKPYAYQIIENQKIEVKCEYILSDSNKVSFKLGKNYDTKYDVIIDPEVVFSSYSGSYSDNWGFTATYDSLGNMYIGGIEYFNLFNNSGFPIFRALGAYQTSFQGGDFDMVFMKLSTDGKQLLSSTYYGGRNDDRPMSMIVNSQNELVVLGVTNSSGYYFTTGTGLSGGTDLLITKFNSSLTSVIGARYFGGSSDDGLNNFTDLNYKFYGDDYKSEIILDSLDNIYIASSTNSADFPVTPDALMISIGGVQDGIFAKFSSNLTTLYSSLIGGDDTDACHSIKISSNGNVYVLGNSKSQSFNENAIPFFNSKPGAIDGFIVEFLPNLSITTKQIWIGTPSNDKLALMEFDKQNNVYVVGNTWSNTFLITSTGGSIYSNPNSGQFVIKITPNLENILFSTQIGAGTRKPEISFTAFQIDDCNQILLGGWYNTNLFEIGNIFSPNMTGLPTTSDAFQKFTDKPGGFYFAVYNPNMTGLRYATQFGGQGFEHVDGGTSRFDKKGVIYQAVCAGCRGNSNTKTTSRVWSMTNNSNNCNMLGIKIDLKYIPIQIKVATNPPLQANNTISGRLPLTINFINSTTEYTNKTSFQWAFHDGKLLNSNFPTNFSFTYDKMGRYEAFLKATDSSSCKSTDSKKITVFVNPYVDSLEMCIGESKKFTVTGGTYFEWIPENFLDDFTSASPTTNADSTQRYKVIVADETNSYTYELNTRVIVYPKTNFRYDLKLERDIEKSNVSLKTLTNVNTINWQLENLISTQKEQLFTLTEEGEYVLSISGLDSNNCFYSKKNLVDVKKIYIPNVFTPNGDGVNDSFKIRNLLPNNADLEIFNRWGTKMYEEINYTNNWTANELPDGLYYYLLKFRKLDKSITTFKGWVNIIR